MERVLNMQSNNIVEYIDEGHFYLVNGILTPSVSQLLKQVFPNKYKGIPRRILDAKASYGTTVHDAIERLENGEKMPNMNVFQKLSIEQYEKLKAKHGFKVQNQEQIIHYRDCYCGRYDMTLVNQDGALCLGDIKTTSQLDKDYLSWQLSLYEMAYEYTFQTEQFPFSKFYCVWLPKNDLGEFVEIKRIERQKILDTFKYE